MGTHNCTKFASFFNHSARAKSRLCRLFFNFKGFPLAESPVIVTQGTQAPRRCSDCGRFTPAGTRSEDQHLFFGADPDDYDRTRCASCARTELHKRNMPHYPDGCQLCSDTVRRRADQHALELRKAGK